MAHRGSETEFELATIEPLLRLGRRHIHGSELDRPPEEVVLRDRLRACLPRVYADVPSAAVDETVNHFSRPEGADTLRRNMAFHEGLTGRIEVRVEQPGRRVEHRHMYTIDWDRPAANEFLVVNQLPVLFQVANKTVAKG